MSEFRWTPRTRGMACRQLAREAQRRLDRMVQEVEQSERGRRNCWPWIETNADLAQVACGRALSIARERTGW